VADLGGSRDMQLDVVGLLETDLHVSAVNATSMERSLIHGVANGIREP
jgi:hypothetical protein